jgi:serine/threonine-protein kinase RsbW
MHSNQSWDPAGVDELLDSTLDSVDSAESAVLRLAEQAGFGEDAMHELGVAVREAMVNAVAHGNRYSARKKVHLEARLRAGGLWIRIADEGDGFDTKDVPDPLSQENLLRQSGRGLLLIRAFVDEFRMEPAQPKGTALEMVKYLNQQR